MATETEAPERGLAKLFREGQTDIKTARTTDLFQELQERSLTDAEEDIIRKRVEHQRKMLEMYERSDKRRKIAELMEMCPDLSEEEVTKALEMCNGKEDEAGHLLITDPSFMRRARGGRAPPSGQATRSERPRDFGARPKLVELSNLNGSVFCGLFRGRGSFPVQKEIAAEETVLPTESSVEPITPLLTDAPGVPIQAVKEQTPVQDSDRDMEDNGTAEGPAPDNGAVNAADMVHAAGNSSSPVSEPAEKCTPDAKQHMLVQVTEDGQLVPVTTTGLKKVRRAVGVPSDSVGSKLSGHATVKPAAISPPSVTKATKASLVAKSIAKSIKRLLTMDPATRRETLQELDVFRPAQAERRRQALQPGEDSSAHPAATPATEPPVPVAEKVEAEALTLPFNEKAAVTVDKAPEVLALNKPLVNATAVLAARSLSQRSARSQVARLMAMKPGMRKEVAEQLDVNDPDTAGQRKALLIEAEPAVTVTTKASDFLAEEDDAASCGTDKGSPETGAVAGVAPATVACDAGQSDPSKQVALLAKRAGPLRRLRAASSASRPVQETVSTGAVITEPSGLAVPAENKEAMDIDCAGATAKAPAAVSLDSEETEVDEAIHSTDVSPMSQAESKEEQAVKKAKQAAATNSRPKMSGRLGRLRKSSHKQIELIQVGSAVFGDGWHNSGYIFPDGFVTRTQFRSSVNVDQLTIYESSIIGEGGKFWPKPTFRVVGMDRPDEPLIAGSCTGCWSQVLKRINAEIEALRKAGDPRPAPPKTAIAGPEYFGLSHTEVVAKVEELDPERKCMSYWEGREERDALLAGLPPPPRAQRPVAPKTTSAQPKPEKSRRRKRGRGGDSSDDDDFEDSATANRWSSVSRTDRYKKRCGTNGDVDEDNPLPDFVDPITLEPVVAPAISPYGHVMGSATWKAVLAEQGKCPFTQQQLRWSQIKVLTKSNISAYADQIKR